MADTETLDDTTGASRRHPLPERLALVCVWSADDAHVGDVLGPLPHGQEVVFGRGEDDGREARVSFVRQRPGANQRTETLANPYLSRSQLKLRNDGATISVENLGKRALYDTDGIEKKQI